MAFDSNNIEDFDALGNEHVGTSENTPMRNDALNSRKRNK